MTFYDILAQLAQGVSYTVLVTLVCSVTGLVVGLALASLRRLDFPRVNSFIDGYAYVFRGVPVLVLLFIVYFGLPGIGFKVPPLLAMALSLGLVASAYLSEVFRGAFNSVDPAEILAAKAMGMTRWQVLLYIELPQMLRFSVPGMVNEFTTVLKFSPFAYTVGIPEITKQAMTLTATTLRGIEIYLAVGVLYFVIYRICLIGVQVLSKRYQIPGMGSV
ncbi:MAG: amino acid ABC transporter permease [Polynucleobacter victoriensis]